MKPVVGGGSSWEADWSSDWSSPRRKLEDLIKRMQVPEPTSRPQPSPIGQHRRKRLPLTSAQPGLPSPNDRALLGALLSTLAPSAPPIGPVSTPMSSMSVRNNLVTGRSPNVEDRRDMPPWFFDYLLTLGWEPKGNWPGGGGGGGSW